MILWTPYSDRNLLLSTAVALMRKQNFDRTHYKANTASSTLRLKYRERKTAKWDVLIRCNCTEIEINASFLLAFTTTPAPTSFTYFSPAVSTSANASVASVAFVVSAYPLPIFRYSPISSIKATESRLNWNISKNKRPQ